KVQMDRKQKGKMVLDLCSSCTGVWFDREELQQIWKMVFNAVAKDAASDPFVAWYGADVAAGLAGDGEVSPGVKLSEVANTTLGTIVKTVATAFEPPKQSN
ncbi:MAG TPA: zf-TFIIB domain-containing protein, partial [Longimicrobiales bacterium]|nr:zf-TFIIB domain-containing protein [Longimicrobiales bacterium]